MYGVSGLASLFFKFGSEMTEESKNVQVSQFKYTLSVLIRNAAKSTLVPFLSFCFLIFKVSLVVVS